MSSLHNQGPNQMSAEDDDWRCQSCNGTGKFLPNCETCQGDGWVHDDENGGTMTCPSCENEECGDCQGTGEAPDD